MFQTLIVFERTRNRRRRDFALAAKSRDNGLVRRAAVHLDRDAAKQPVVGWTAEWFSSRGAGG
jgi:hypothetical protein